VTVTYVDRNTGERVTPIVLHRTEHDWHYRETRTYNHSNINRGEFTLRASIRRNFYDSQSFARIEKWGPSGWETIEQYPIEGLEAQTVSVREVHLSERSHLALEDTAERLFIYGERFMRHERNK
jgi:hypothetical protein